MLTEISKHDENLSEFMKDNQEVENIWKQIQAEKTKAAMAN
jgi:hypothetical protein